MLSPTHAWTSSNEPNIFTDQGFQNRFADGKFSCMITKINKGEREQLLKYNSFWNPTTALFTGLQYETGEKKKKRKKKEREQV